MAEVSSKPTSPRAAMTAAVSAPAADCLTPAESEAAQVADAAPQDPIFNLSAQEYLEQSVMGVLTQGLEDVCRVRPANPVDYLALYLLRRSQASNVVEVPYSEAVPQVQPRTV